MRPILRRSLLAAPALAAPARAQEAVDLLLVLAMDASGSIDEDEFRLQREGYADALAHPQVLAAIRSKRRGAVAIAILEWGSPGASAAIVDWRRVADAASAQALGEALLKAERSPQSYNAIGDALDHAGRLLRAAPFAADQQVIDLSGDGPDLRSLRRAPDVRDELVARGVVINALAIAASGMVTRFGERLEETYRREVIGGPGAFVATAEDRRDIARALRAKLVREIA
ncbi:DUF1194 domain-containing protein [Roseococcus sp. YIM B11640]|uniref:DUF1194 domain-containing protein n=1 Tax=Roseococcus sp. YIM B11640 TaxID=3133973 RepID=UPI003C7A1D1B